MVELLNELDMFWNMSGDPRFKGEHPRCSEILTQLEAEFSNMAEDDLRELLDSMDTEQLEQVTGALMGLDYDWITEYEQL